MTTTPTSPADLPVEQYVLRARFPYDFSGPKARYYNAATRQWGTFEDATRYDEAAAKTGQHVTNPTRPGAKVTWMKDLPRDLDGYPYDPNTEGGPWRLTLCCAAGTSIDDGPLYCKSCYAEMPLDLDTPPRLDADWNPGNGPIRIVLPPQGDA